jgi:hypothetical protein
MARSVWGVRRAKAALSSGCKSHPAIAPAMHAVRKRTQQAAKEQMGRAGLRIRRPKIRQHTLRHNQKSSEIAATISSPRINKIVSKGFDIPQIEFSVHLVTEHSMDSKSRFYALEVMCRERARLADKESNYWLAEAEEWARLRLSCHKRGAPCASSGGPMHSNEVKG